MFCLIIHHFAPRKVVVPIDLTDKMIISSNLFLTGLSASVFLRIANSYDGIYGVQSYLDVPPKELLYPLAWVTVEETSFFLIHRFLHQPGIYDKCHKMHHKFKTTSAWTSFYSHPLDQLFAILWTALGPPLLQVTLLSTPASAPVVTLWLFGAIITFTSTHHTVIGAGGHAEGTDHLEHHQKFNVNFGNFGFYDQRAGSYASAEEQRRKNKEKDAKAKAK